MIVAPCFPDDTNETLMWVQHDIYFPIIGEWFRRARVKYLWAEEVVGVRTALGVVIQHKKSFDHRIVQYAHDRVAAFFRFQKPDLNTPRFRDEEGKQRLHVTWFYFAQNEFDRLIESPIFLRAFLKAIADEDENVGVRSVQTINNILDEKYSEMNEGNETV